MLGKIMVGMGILLAFALSQIQAADRSILLQASIGSAGVRYEQKVGENRSWGGAYDVLNATSAIVKVDGYILDLSHTNYHDEMFVGSWGRVGVRYANANGASKISNATAKATLVVPYLQAGHNFNLSNNILAGAAIGLGYGFGSSSGSSGVSIPFNGFVLMLDLSLGLKI